MVRQKTPLKCRCTPSPFTSSSKSIMPPSSCIHPHTDTIFSVTDLRLKWGCTSSWSKLKMRQIHLAAKSSKVLFNLQVGPGKTVHHNFKSIKKRGPSLNIYSREITRQFTGNRPRALWQTIKCYGLFSCIPVYKHLAYHLRWFTDITTILSPYLSIDTIQVTAISPSVHLSYLPFVSFSSAYINSILILMKPAACLVAGV
jgi:hypothetical protein